MVQTRSRSNKNKTKDKVTGTNGDSSNKQKTIESYFIKVNTPKSKGTVDDVKVKKEEKASNLIQSEDKIKDKKHGKGRQSNGEDKKLKRGTTTVKVKSEEDEEIKNKLSSPELNLVPSLKEEDDFSELEDNNQISQYELLRQANIQQNMLKLAELATTGISLKSSLLKPTKSNSKPKPRTKRVYKPKPEPIKRSSRRLLGLEADKVDYELVKSLNLDIPLHEYKDSKDVVKEEPREIKVKVDDRFYPNSSFQLVVASLKNKSEPIQDWIPVDEEDVVKVEDLMKTKINQLQARYPDPIKATQERIYTTQFHPSLTHPLLFVGSKVGEFTILDISQPFDASTMQYDYDVLTTKLRPHSMAVTGIKVNINDETKVFTSSHDGTIRQLDLVKQTFETKLNRDRELFSTIDTFSDNSNLLTYATLNGTIGVMDLRTDKVTTSFTANLKRVKIGCVSVNPANTSILATSSLDRTLKLWDLRKVPSSPDSSPIDFHEDNYLQSIPFNLSVSSGFWSTCGRALVATTYEHKLKVYDFANQQLELKKEFLHNCKTGMYTTNFMAKFHPDVKLGRNLVVCGDMKRAIHFYNATEGVKKDGKLLKGPLAKLEDKELFTAIPAVLNYHPKASLNGNVSNLMATGNSSGNVVVLE